MIFVRLYCKQITCGINCFSVMELNGNCAVSSESIEDLSEYTDADESISAPTEILAEVKH